MVVLAGGCVLRACLEDGLEGVACAVLLPNLLGQSKQRSCSSTHTEPTRCTHIHIQRSCRSVSARAHTHIRTQCVDRAAPSEDTHGVHIRTVQRRQ
jgi:hypothetical protein